MDKHNKSKSELIEQMKKNLSKAQEKESFDFDNKDQLEVINDIATVSTSNLDIVPFYELLSVEEQKISGIWPPTTLPIRGLIPYLKRMQKKGSITGLIVNDVSGANVRFLLDTLDISVYVSNETTSELFVKNTEIHKDSIMELNDTVLNSWDKSELDFIFIASPFPAEEILKKYYPKLKNGGYFSGCNYNSDKNISIIKQFKKNNKIGVSVEITEFGSWSWMKESYTDREVSTNITVTPPIQSGPKPEDSHLKSEYVEKYGVGRIFVETGTYIGQTVELMQRMSWSEINSIEIDEELAQKAKEKFKDDERVKIWVGDSIDMLKKIVDHIDEPATFFLDAHPSGPLKGGRTGGSTIIYELETILNGRRNDHTIFIDDKRLFGSAEWGYVTLEDAMKLVEKINPAYHIYLLDGEIKGDLICLTTR